MSKEIDEKVVQMQFDNKNFESNVRTSLSTIEKLKQSLNFTGSSKSLENINAAAKNVNMSPLANAVETVRNKFSALEIMGMTALVNITNSAVNAGKKIVSALTIDPIKTGFQEYETQINAVQTILANTQSKGTTLDDVNNALDELNTYADKTIYNFTEMTRNIGTFTAAGVDLDTSVSAIQGIANLAAISGSTSQQASTAMYQLSQALANGKVSLQDWNSVVNAGMGGEVFQTALKRTAENMGTNVDALIEQYGSFRESLTQGEWLTTDVLTQTLNQLAGAYTEAELIAQGYTEAQAKEILELAKTAEDAATKVKTFTQLWDTLKESAQSGWTQSWEIIIGDFEEAKEMLTSVSDTLGEFINKSSEARNKVLSDWKELGGRTALIESIKNMFEGLISVVKPIKEAFSDIFPAITGQQLFNITKGLQSLTEKFKMSDETADKIKRTFKGLFSIIDIGKELFVAFAQALSPVGSFLLKLADGVLSATAVFGDYITGIAEVIDQTNLFGLIFEALGKMIEPVATFIKNAIDKIKESFDSLGTFEIGDLGGLTNNIKGALTPFERIGEFFEWSFSKLSTVLSKVGSMVSKAFDVLKTALTEGLDSPAFDRVLGFLNGGLVTGILLGLRSIIDNLKDMISGGGGILSGITGILDGVKGSLEAYQKQLKAGTLIKIASAIAILAGSLTLISMIDSSKLTSSLTAIGVMMAELMGSMAIFELISGSKKFKSLTKISTNMILMSTAILILSNAMKNLAELDWNEIGKGLTGVAGLCAILVASSTIMSKNSGKMTSTAIGLYAFAGAISVLIGSVKELGTMDTTELTKGLIGVGVLCTELALFMKVTDLNGMGLSKSIGLIALASSIIILAKAVNSFSSMDSDSLVKGLGAVTIVLTELAAFVNLTGNATKVTSTAIGLTILAAAMIIYGEAIKRMGNLSIEQIGKGLLTMAGALAVIVAALKLMPTNILATSVGLTILAAGLVILSDALKTMGQMTWDEMGKGLGTLIISLGTLAAAVNLMNGCLAGAAAILVVSAALSILAPVIVTLGSMSWTEIGAGLLALAGAFTVIGVAGLLLTPVVPTLIGLGAAITLLGVGCLAAGVGILAFSTGLASLAAVGAAGVQVIITIFTEIINLIPTFVQRIGEGIIEFAKVIIDGAPVIAQAVISIIEAVLNVIGDVIPSIVDTILNLLTTLVKTIAEHVPQFVQAGVDLIVGFLEGIANNIANVVDAAIQIVVNFLNAIGEKVPEVVDAGFNLIISFINGLTDSIESNTPILVSAMDRLFDAVVDAALSILTSSVNNFTEAGSKIMNSGLIQGIKNKISSAISTVKEIPSKCVSAIKGFVGDFISAGADLVGGLVSGITSKISSAIETVSGMASNLISAAKNILGINSPSKEFEEIGMYTDLGLAKGTKKYAKVAIKATEGVADSVIETMRDTISRLSTDNIDSQPTIRPVIDMSAIEAGADDINKLFSTRQMVSVGGVANANVSSISSMMGATRISATNDDVVSAIDSLKKTITKSSGETNVINGITYDDGSNITNAVKSIIRAAKVERRK